MMAMFLQPIEQDHPDVTGIGVPDTVIALLRHRHITLFLIRLCSAFIDVAFGSGSIFLLIGFDFSFGSSFESGATGCLVVFEEAFDPCVSMLTHGRQLTFARRVEPIKVKYLFFP